MLGKFFAVTEQACFEVRVDLLHAGGFARLVGTVEKIAGEEDEKFPVGATTFNDRVAITKQLQLFRGGPGKELRETNVVGWGWHSSDIVGLFLKKEDALATFEFKASKETLVTMARSTIRAIGENHPVFEVCCEDEKWSLFHPWILRKVLDGRLV